MEKREMAKMIFNAHAPVRNLSGGFTSLYMKP